MWVARRGRPARHSRDPATGANSSGACGHARPGFVAPPRPPPLSLSSSSGAARKDRRSGKEIRTLRQTQCPPWLFRASRRAGVVNPGSTNSGNERNPSNGIPPLHTIPPLGFLDLLKSPCIAPGFTLPPRPPRRKGRYASSLAPVRIGSASACGAFVRSASGGVSWRLGLRWWLLVMVARCWPRRGGGRWSVRRCGSARVAGVCGGRRARFPARWWCAASRVSVAPSALRRPGRVGAGFRSRLRRAWARRVASGRFRCRLRRRWWWSRRRRRPCGAGSLGFVGLSRVAPVRFRGRPAGRLRSVVAVAPVRRRRVAGGVSLPARCARRRAPRGLAGLVGGWSAGGRRWRLAAGRVLGSASARAGVAVGAVRRAAVAPSRAAVAALVGSVWPAVGGVRVALCAARAVSAPSGVVVLVRLVFPSPAFARAFLCKNLILLVFTVNTNSIIISTWIGAFGSRAAVFTGHCAGRKTGKTGSPGTISSEFFRRLMK